MKPRVKSALIKGEVSPYKRPKESVPSPGQYENDILKFGKSEKKITFGGKY